MQIKRTKKQTFTSPVIALCSVLSFQTFYLYAEENAEIAEEAKGHVIEVIEINARKRVESIQESPLAVSAFTGDALKNRGLGDISQMDQFVPNLSFDTTAPISGSSNTSSVFIRGIGQTDFVFTSDPGVGIYLDGVYIARSTGSVLDSMDIERVEIIRGPQGTLFGKNTIGGAISVTTARPDEEFRGAVEVTVGNFGNKKLRGYVNIPITDDFYTRLSLSSNEKDGYATRILTGQSLGGEDKQAARLTARWYAADSLTFDFSADYSTANEESPASSLVNFNSDEIGGPSTLFAGLAYNNLIGGNPLAGSEIPALAAFSLLPGLPADTPRYDSRFLTGDLRKSNATGPTGSKYDIFGSSLIAEWDVNEDFTIKSITGYREFDSQFGRDADGSPLNLVHTMNDMSHEQFSQEFQFIGSSFDNTLNWVAGIYYFDETGTDLVEVSFAQETFDIYASLGTGCDLSQIGGPNLIPAGICPNIFRVDASGNGTKVDNQSKAVFLEVDYALTDKLDLTLGARYSEDIKGIDISGYLIGGAPGIADPVQEETFTDISGRFILNYHWKKDLITYLSYSQGYKSGGFNSRYGLPLEQPTFFNPEEVDSWEAGLKLDFWNGHARLNTAIFSADYNDIQVVVFDNGIPRTINAAEGKIEGLEAELILSPIDNVKVDISYGYLDARYTELDTSVVGSFGAPIVNPIESDYLFVNTPENSVSLGAQYDAELSDNSLLIFRADISYKDKVANDAINTPELIQKSLTLLNVTASYVPNDGNWKIALYGKNLADKEYITSGVADKPGFGLVEANVARPREFGAVITYNF
ncbi:MAG: iron complex outermembrane receptor protein [Paraglaciecola sp.]|jgi:iron complex outermembrane receptor protein